MTLDTYYVDHAAIYVKSYVCLLFYLQVLMLSRMLCYFRHIVTLLIPITDCLVFPGRSPVDSRGGQLQIAGVVVGNWGANTQSHGNQRGNRVSGPNNQPPQVMSVGPRR